MTVRHGGASIAFFNRKHGMYQPIESYGIIGDLHTAALVGMNGSIDLMCFPRFDSPSIFAALLDDKRGGRFQIAPTLDDAHQKQIYMPDSNILLTRFLSGQGVAEVSDFMTLDECDRAHALVRRVKTVRGETRIRAVCEPRFNYGRSSHSITRKKDGVQFASEGPDRTTLRLRSDVSLEPHEGAAIAEFTLAAGETATFVLECPELSETGDDLALTEYVSTEFKETLNYWRLWMSRCRYSGRWREIVNRSALVLKLLTSREYGSVVAAPTFGLPERIGGDRNWDYRYTWIRDASFTLYALMRLGYTDEAGAFMKWIEQRCDELEPDGALQVMYAIDGRHQLDEQTLDTFEGYRGSPPVRIGNGAYNQLQLDIYGELMDSVYIYNRHGEPISFDLWKNLTRLVNWVCRNWRRRDAGIWEVRGGEFEFLYSRLMCWVALDRALRIARNRSFPAPREEWLSVRDEIYNDIVDNFWDPKQASFVQYRGATTLDAASLLMPLVKFVGPTDNRWLSTLRQIENQLVDDSLVYRYLDDEVELDGIGGAEGTFNMCSFWYIECLARAGDLRQARFLLEKMLGFANHVGLYSEELGPRGEHLGNYPQAFTHLGLISAAVNLDYRLSKAHEL